MEDIKNNENMGSPEEVKTYTEEEVLKLVQSEADKRVSQALKTQQAKFEKQMSEAEKLRQMDETTREQYQLQQRIAELEEQNKQFVKAENKATLAKALAERNLPVQFVDYLVGEDADSMMNNVNEFEKAWKAAVNDAVSAQMVKGTPKGNTQQSGLTTLKGMSMAQKQELYTTNKKLFMELSQNG